MATQDCVTPAAAVAPKTKAHAPQLPQIVDNGDLTDKEVDDVFRQLSDTQDCGIAPAARQFVGEEFAQARAIVQMCVAAVDGSDDAGGFRHLAETVRFSLDRARELLNEAESFWDMHRVRHSDTYTFEEAFYQSTALLRLFDYGAYDGMCSFRADGAALAPVLRTVVDLLDLVIVQLEETPVHGASAA